MSNKYLEKIARNKQEQYLANKPRNAKFSDPRVARAHKYVQDAKSELKNARSLKELGASAEVVQKYKGYAQDIMRKQRGNIVDTKTVKVESPFKNVGDILAKNRRNPINRVAKYEQTQTPKVRLNKYLKKSPGKAALIGSGIVLGAAGIANGVRTLIKD